MMEFCGVVTGGSIQSSDERKPLSGSEIRSIASKYGYTEIDENKASRVISFRGDSANSIRINVYYTTGTVGTCINHPTRGKTQLFRRGVLSFEEMEAIFRDPRVHTGVGYYRRKSIVKPWKRIGSADDCLRDSARRWMFVGNATGLFKNDLEQKVVVEIVTLWDDLCWEPNNLPNLLSTRYSCGSRCGLGNILCEVALLTFRHMKPCSQEDVQLFLDGEISSNEINTRLPYGHECSKLHAFMSAHETDVRKIRNKLLSLRKDLRTELLQWLLGRDRCGLSFRDKDFRPIKTQFSDAVSAALIDYGELMYPKKANLCNHCGVIYQREG